MRLRDGVDLKLCQICKCFVIVKWCPWMNSPIYIHVKVNLGLLNFPVSGRNWDQSDEYLKILFSLFLTFTEIVIIYEEVIFNLHWNCNMKKLEIYFWHMTRLQLAVPLLSNGNDVIKRVEFIWHHLIWYTF